MNDRMKGDIDNALLVGMSIQDAYVYAGVSPSEITLLEQDEDWQRYVAKTTRQHEYRLLQSLDRIIDKQTHMGKEGAVTWLLERVNSRYAGKAVSDGKPITINFNNTDPVSEDTVEVHT